jgi:hypothetical protein
MKTPLLCSTLLAALLCVSGAAQASLVGRDINGNAVAGNAASSVFLYDDVLNVTWLRNANANGAMNWTQANTWANSLNNNAAYGNFTGWRLPTMIDTGTSGCNYANVGTDCGYNVQTKSGNLTQYQAGQTVYSEMAHLFYVTLGNQGYYSTTGTFQPGFGLSNTGAFQNLQSFGYWSGLEYAPSTIRAWVFDTYDGLQVSYGKAGSLYALAVRPGDVLAPAAVPIPAAAWLMASGLGALGVAARKRRAKAA